VARRDGGGAHFMWLGDPVFASGWPAAGVGPAQGAVASQGLDGGVASGDRVEHRFAFLGERVMMDYFTDSL